MVVIITLKTKYLKIKINKGRYLIIGNRNGIVYELPLITKLKNYKKQYNVRKLITNNKHITIKYTNIRHERRIQSCSGGNIIISFVSVWQWYRKIVKLLLKIDKTIVDYYKFYKKDNIEMCQLIVNTDYDLLLNTFKLLTTELKKNMLHIRQ